MALVATTYLSRCSNVAYGIAQIDEVKKIALKIDAIVLIVSIDQSIEAEGREKVDIQLPRQQPLLLIEVAKRSKETGRLPMTYYPQSYVDKVPMTNINMRSNLANGYYGRTCWFYIRETIYTFTDGLRYTLFKHHLVQAPKSISIPLEEGGHSCHSSKCKSMDVMEESC
ncbi:hypothetical protein AAG906_022091 [Vitis piasezkii]